MCAIFGLLQTLPIALDELQRMSVCLRHRGPDDEGFLLLNRAGHAQHRFGDDTPPPVRRYVQDTQRSLPLETGTADITLALGHRRLSILDLSPAGHQPMPYQQRYWLVYNGEIYNYRELRSELIALGYPFHSQSDSEVILAAYAHWGEDCLHRFNGMWAFAILDTVRNTLFLARDRFGIKPLYLYQHGGQLAFASEIKAFSTLGGWRAVRNEARFLDFLIWGVQDHTSETLFQNIHALPAGHKLTVPLANAQALVPPLANQIERWYQVQPQPAHHNDAVVAFRALFHDSIRLRQRSDVPVGFCLSGGLDSSAIVCSTIEQHRQPEIGNAWHTFTAGSRHPKFDETRYAQAVIAHTGATEHVLYPDEHALEHALDALVWHQDEPFATTSIFAQWSVFQAAHHSNIKVMLDGQGADEILCGYQGYIGAHMAALLHHGKIGDFVRTFTQLRHNSAQSSVKLAAYGLSYLAPALRSTLLRRRHRLDDPASWVQPQWLAQHSQDPRGEERGSPPSLLAMSLAQLQRTNLPMLLHWEDRNSMAHSIEARLPFLDYRLVEFCLGLPDAMKIQNGQLKYLLRQAMQGTVPDVVLQRKDKMGFVTPEEVWLGKDNRSMHNAVYSAIAGLQEFIGCDLKRDYQAMLNNKLRYHSLIWRMLCAHRWQQVYQVQ